MEGEQRHELGTVGGRGGVLSIWGGVRGDFYYNGKTVLEKMTKKRVTEAPLRGIFTDFNVKATSCELVAKWAASALFHPCVWLERVEFLKVGSSFKQPSDFVSVQLSSQQWENSPPRAHIPARQ